MPTAIRIGFPVHALGVERPLSSMNARPGCRRRMIIGGDGGWFREVSAMAVAGVWSGVCATPGTRSVGLLQDEVRDRRGDAIERQ